MYVQIHRHLTSGGIHATPHLKRDGRRQRKETRHPPLMIMTVVPGVHTCARMHVCMHVCMHLSIYLCTLRKERT